MKKLVIIGAGSAMFTQGLVMDLIMDRSGDPWHLGLVDINGKALETVTLLTRKMIEAKGSEIEVSSSTDRREILDGASYVVSTIGVGGRRAWEQDVLIPRKYGIYQPVGDTVMPGGISRALRMIPALVEIANDIAAICPDARFFNYANPMAANCAALRRATDVPVVGLCHGVPHSVRSLAGMVGAKQEEVTAHAVGINHLTFVYALRAHGEDLLPKLRETIEERRRTGIDPSRIGALAFRDGGEEVDPFSWAVFEALNAYPVPGDRHVTEFYGDVFPQGYYYGKRLGVDAFSFEEIIQAGDEIYERMGKLARSDKPLDESFFGRIGGEHEQLVEIIHALESDTRRIYSVNMPNGNCYSNLPAGSVLELPAISTKDGLVPLPFDNFPDILVPTIKRHLGIIDLAVDAALTGNRRSFVEAIRAGGYLREKKAIEAMVDELLRAQSDYLPQFGA